jgi:hypothetical protein
VLVGALKRHFHHGLPIVSDDNYPRALGNSIQSFPEHDFFRAPRCLSLHIREIG